MTMLTHFKLLGGGGYSVNAPGAQILLGCDDAKLFETPILNNHSVTVPSAHILLEMTTHGTLNPPSKNKHSFIELIAHVYLDSDSLQC